MQLVPQIWYNWKRKSTKGLPALMMFIWGLGAIPFGIYAVVQQFNIPLQIQPQIFGVCAFITWAQCLHYGNSWKWKKVFIYFTCVVLLAGGLEAVGILSLRIPYAAGTEWPILLVGILASIVLVIGLLPPYFELWKRGGEVVGINFYFLGLDFAGAIFSILSLVVENRYEFIALFFYSLIGFMELGIFASHMIWMIRMSCKCQREDAIRSNVCSNHDHEKSIE